MDRNIRRKDESTIRIGGFNICLSVIANAVGKLSLTIQMN
jgi:hypothetical protein